MPATTNPFPGMNPFLQESWSDVHTTLISLIREALSDELPPDFSARAEERIVLSEAGEEKRAYRTDVAVVEPWRAGLPPVISFGLGQQKGATLTVAEPLLFAGTIMPERWIEIHSAGGGLITVIEVLSPANKTTAGQQAYRDRQYHFLSAGVHLVEIDLIRGGMHVVSVDPEQAELRWPSGTCHMVCTARMLGEGESRWEVYLCPLRQPLPTIRVPLRRGEADVALALQPLVDRCYRTGRYWLSPASVQALHPPAADAEEAAWTEECLQAAGRK
jgi:hypothetical protein